MGFDMYFQEVAMNPWVLLGEARVAVDGKRLSLYRRDTEFSIRLGGNGGELMNSRSHGSEEKLAELACARLTEHGEPHVLIGGLGMGFTLAAALRQLGAAARVTVSELVPEVVAWNRGPLGELAGQPLTDPRVTVCEGDVARMIAAQSQAYDAILLDVDNGPEGLTHTDNDWLYGCVGLSAAYEALRPGGVLAVWSAGRDVAFTGRLLKAGFEVEEVRVRARGTKGARHMIWLAQRGG
jgi:spermidine synthase